MILVLILSICSLTGGKVAAFCLRFVLWFVVRAHRSIIVSNKKRQGCKPGSVPPRLNERAGSCHLSRTAVTRSLNLPTPRGKRRGQRLPFRAPGVHGISPRKVYICPQRHRCGGGLLPRLFTLTSVTKGWKSPRGGYFLLHCLSREAFLTKLPAPSC